MEPSHTANQLPQTGSRLPQVDMLRGFALLGIGLENIFTIHSPNEVFAQYATQYPEGLNHYLITGLMLLVRGKFYPIFSLVFGIAFAFSLAKDGPLYFTKRLGVFLALGLLQVLFVWTGDVLLQYAAMGLLLVFCRNLSVRVLLTLSALLLAFSFLGAGLFPSTTVQLMPPAIYQTGSFWEISNARITDYCQSVFTWNALLFYAKIFAFMVLGYAVAKSGFLQKLQRPSIALKTLAVQAGVVLVMVLLFHVMSWRGQENPAQSWLKNGFLAVYFYGFVASYSLLPFALPQILSPLQKLGQFTLTHYLLQNLVFSLLLYGYGFGLMGTLSPGQLMLVYVMLLACQVVATAVYAAYFKLGPMEYLVRKLAGWKE
ncbi:DUF418 domain-containing protein [Rufibacter sp. LB8]|uniref:DUF418 domain-containing protein n=1 Tax=Rufibacter sp. LB8 TaxID=2777781 RepID=UPI00178C1C0D|nr:DUF418 domain-containing protein [Rufibacter sp. LB8]